VANPTDPDSGIMKTRRGWMQGYNAQAAVTPEQIILAADVTCEANDVHQLSGMLDQAQANVEAVMGEDALLGAAVADAGYWSERACKIVGGWFPSPRRAAAAPSPGLTHRTAFGPSSPRLRARDVPERGPAPHDFACSPGSTSKSPASPRPNSSATWMIAAR
jgi:hypothetical protein